MKKLALHWKIIIGMVLGVVYGLLASHFGIIEFTNDWIKPWGKIFISLLKLIAVPLVLASLSSKRQNNLDMQILQRQAFNLANNNFKVDEILDNIEKDGYEFNQLKLAYQNLEEMEKWEIKD